MSELLPCPFCGGEADVIDYDDECWVAHQCANGTAVETDSYETVNEAIAAWNTRVERTCSVVCIIDGLIMDEPNSIELSCGHTFETWDEVPPNYCPNCGARVMGE